MIWLITPFIRVIIIFMRRIIYSELPLRRSCEGVTAPVFTVEFYHEIKKARGASASHRKT